MNVSFIIRNAFHHSADVRHASLRNRKVLYSPVSSEWDTRQGQGRRAWTGTQGRDRDTGQGQGCHIHVLPAGPQPRQSQRLEMQGSAKGKGRVPMGTESAETSKLKKERSSKVCSQQDYVDMVVWV